MYKLLPGTYGKFIIGERHVTDSPNEYIIIIKTEVGELQVYGLLNGSKKKQGWIHKGPWVKDYEELTKQYVIEDNLKEKQLKNVQKRTEEEKQDKINRIKAAYKK